MSKTLSLSRLFLVVGLSFLSANAAAFEPHGWFWGEDVVVPVESKAPEVKKEAPPTFDQLSADEQVALLRETTLNAIHTMDLNPTPQNAKIVAQWLNFWSDKASDVTNAYREMLVENPDLDYHLAHPTESAALSVTKKLEAEKNKAAIESLSAQYGIFYFYEGKSPYEKSLSPVINHFAESYHVRVIPISVDGVSDDQFSDSRLDSGQAARLQVTHFPAIILVNPQTGESRPLHYGFITEEALAKQFYYVATNFKGEH